MENDLYKACVYCKYFNRKNDLCTNDRVFEPNDFGVYLFVENGYLSAAIHEGSKELYSIETQVKDSLIDEKIPLEQIEKTIRALSVILEDTRTELVAQINDSVLDAVDNFDFKASGITIKEPDKFYCKSFM